MYRPIYHARRARHGLEQYARVTDRKRQFQRTANDGVQRQLLKTSRVKSWMWMPGFRRIRTAARPLTGLLENA